MVLDPQIIKILLVLLTSAIVSIEVAYHSTLSYQIKSFLFSNKVNSLSKFNNWIKIMGIKYTLLFSPVVFLFKIVVFIKELLDCPYCQSVWYTFFLLFFYLKITLSLSLLIAPVTILVVLIIEKFLFKD